MGQASVSGAIVATRNKERDSKAVVPEGPEIEEVWKLIQRHQAYTRSEPAAKVLANWPASVLKFVKVMPKDYKRVLQALNRVKEQGLSGDQAIMAAFEENIRDVARVGGG